MADVSGSVVIFHLIVILAFSALILKNKSALVIGLQCHILSFSFLYNHFKRGW